MSPGASEDRASEGQMQSAAAHNANANGTTTTKHNDMRDYVAPSLFQPHNARQAVRDAHNKKIPTMLGYYAGLSSVPITRWLTPMGFDCVWIDWEHSSCNVETMTTMVHETMFMSEGRTIPWVRVPGHDHAAIGYALDAGASIVIPQVETVEQARHVMSAAKYGTRNGGTRSAPPARLFPGLTDVSADPSVDFHKAVNNQAAVMIQIETLQGIRNLDAILAEVPEIDVVWLGTLDCRISMNLAANMGQGGDEPEWLEAVAEFKATLKKHDKPYAGFSLAGGEKLKKDAGEMSMCWIAFDIIALGGMFTQLLDARKLTSLE